MVHSFFEGSHIQYDKLYYSSHKILWLKSDALPDLCVSCMLTDGLKDIK